MVALTIELTMAGQRKVFISDKTLLTWLMAGAFATIGCLLVTAVIVYRSREKFGVGIYEASPDK